jgi:hypothetical protein
MSWLDDLAAAMPPRMVKIGEIADDPILKVTWDGGEPQQVLLWSDNFDLLMSAKGVPGLVGRKVLLLLPDGQPPIITSLLMGVFDATG